MVNSLFRFCSKAKLWARQLIVGVIGAVLALIAGYFLDIRPIHEESKNKLQEIMLLEEEVRELKQKEIKERSVDSLHGQDSPNGSAIDVISFIEQLMFEAGVSLKLLESLPNTEKESSSCFLIKIELCGIYLDLLVFLKKILQSHHLLIIDELNLERCTAGVGEGLKMRLMLSVCKDKGMASDPGKDFLTLDYAANARDVFDRNAVKQDLHLWSSQELRLIGVTKKGRETIGLVVDPVGYAYHVGVGVKVGAGQSKVIAIDRCKIATASQGDNIYRGGKCI